MRQQSVGLRLRKWQQQGASSANASPLAQHAFHAMPCHRGKAVVQQPTCWVVVHAAMPATTRVTSALSSLPTSPVAGPSCRALSATAGCASQPLLPPCRPRETAAVHRTPGAGATWAAPLLRLRLTCEIAWLSAADSLLRAAPAAAGCSMQPREAWKCSLGAALVVPMLRSCTSPLAALTWQSSWTGVAKERTTGAGMEHPARHSSLPGVASPASVRPLQVRDGRKEPSSLSASSGLAFASSRLAAA